MTVETQSNTPLVVVGAGAAGLMAAIWAGRANPQRKIIVLDGASKIGKKILIAGGGRCNVTHYEVTEDAYAGASRNAIRKVLKQFDVSQTIAFFAELGVELKREETGKLFPTTDKAQTVLDALVDEVSRYGDIRTRHRVESVQKVTGGFVVSGNFDDIVADRVVLATGGKSIPKTGSDGGGYQIAMALGHTTTEQIFPALVPLTIPRDHWFRDLKGITLDVTVELWSSAGKRLASFTNSLLLSHFGLTGPAVLDISRYLLDVRSTDLDAQLTINWFPKQNSESFSALLKQEKKRSALQLFRSHLPDRLARSLLATVFEDLDVSRDVKMVRREQLPTNQLTKLERRRLTNTATRFIAPIVGDRGFDFAEVTAGGVPLTEVHLKTMASRVCDGLHLCGEIFDDDGRIGGFNFQWAWASGYLAGHG